MIDSLRARKASLKWRPRQKFVITDAGRTARASYMESISTLPRGETARGALASLQAEWAGQHHILPVDAVVLGELGEDPKLHRQILGGLEDSGLSLSDVQDSVDRLYTSGLVAPADGQPPEERGNA